MNRTKGNAANDKAGLKRSGTKTITTRDIKFEECDDLFLGEKGRKLRNLRKKMDKLNELQRQVKDGEVKPNAQQKEQIASIASTKDQIKELEELCNLYIKSNPNFLQKAAPEEKSAKPAAKGADSAGLEAALTLITRVNVLSAMLKEDTSLVESTPPERDALAVVQEVFDNMVEDCQTGSVSYDQDAFRQDFVEQFRNLANSSTEPVSAGAIPFSDLNEFIEKVFTGDFTKQKIAAKKELAAQKKKEE